MIAQLLFETCLFGPAWSALIAGYAVIGPDGCMYLTQAGSEYLEMIA